MTTIKATLIWFAIALLAIGNGVFRNEVLQPAFGPSISLPLSGVTLSIIVLLVIYLAYPFLGVSNARSRWLVGLQWVTFTLIFEFGFGHYVVGKSWTALLQSFNILNGDLFLLVLLITLAAPSLAARFRIK
jgi:hypothetical protein